MKLNMMLFAAAMAALRSGSNVGVMGFSPSCSLRTLNALRPPSSATTRAATRLFQSVAPPDAQMDTACNSKAKSKVPITLLSGFLGSGKTTALQHLLENTDGVKIGIIVNDVASVNIDAKLVSSSSSAQKLDGAGGVVELQNGCACCSLADEMLASIDQILSSRSADDPLDAIVIELSGVADPLAIQANWQQALVAGVPVTSKADVSQVVTVIDSSTFGTDWMTWDTAGERSGWTDEGENCSGQRKVPELLAEQVESADLILMNKVDIAGGDQTKIATALAKRLNAKAFLEETTFGKISPQKILSNDYLTSVLESKEEGKCSNPGCGNPDCSSSHSHDHDHASHADDKPAEESTSCSDPDYIDESESHTHSHTHSHATSTDNLGIVNFVYKASRPFNQKKLMTVLNTWPVPIKDNLDITLLDDMNAGKPIPTENGSLIDNPFVGVLRSKGFCWFAPTRWTGAREDVWRHDTAMFWSHAGKHFGISSAGKWWDSISKEQMKKYFKTNKGEYERILDEDFMTEEFGDRRQEIVFIGVNLLEEEIRQALDSCLVTERGMKRYRQALQNWELSVMGREHGGPSLFDVGSVDHMDVNK